MNILDLIEQRQSSRVPFDPDRKVPEDTLRQILDAARWAPTAHNLQNFQIVVVDNQKVLEELSKIPATVSHAFIEENYEQLAFSEEDLRRKKVGLLATMFPVSWRAPPFNLEPLPDVAHAGADPQGAHRPERWVEPPEHAVDAQTLLGGPLYLTMTATLLVVFYDPRRRAPASEGDVLGLISLGCVLENMWLVAESLGVAVQVQSVLGASQVEPEVKRILGVPSPLKLGFAVRLGYPTIPAAYLRVRRDLEDFVHRNRVGSKLLPTLAGDAAEVLGSPPVGIASTGAPGVDGRSYDTGDFTPGPSKGRT